MRFRSEQKPPPYLNRRDQYRLLGMVGALCLVAFGTMWASRPSSWHWLVPPDRPAPHTLNEIDFRVQSSPPGSLPPGAFRVVGDNEDVGAHPHSTDGHGGVDSSSIRKDVLLPIEDNTLGLRRSELDAYQVALERADRLTRELEESGGRRDVAFTVLMLEPDNHRGQLIQIAGDLRRLTELAVPEGVSIDRLYEGWLFTRDSGTNPYRIVCTQRPHEIPLGDLTAQPVPVEVTGYFFKRYGYTSKGGQHVAPMLVARTIAVRKTPVGIPAEDGDLQVAVLLLIGLVVTGIVLLVGWCIVSDQRYRGSRLRELAASRLDASPHDLDKLLKVETSDPEQPFARDDSAIES